MSEGLNIFVAGMWLLTAIVSAPFLAWDAMEERDNWPMGFLSGLMMPLIPLIALCLLAAVAVLWPLEKLANLWKADWK